jgi:hypothetical protein
MHEVNVSVVVRSEASALAQCGCDGGGSGLAPLTYVVPVLIAAVVGTCRLVLATVGAGLLLSREALRLTSGACALLAGACDVGGETALALARREL